MDCKNILNSALIYKVCLRSMLIDLNITTDSWECINIFSYFFVINMIIFLECGCKIGDKCSKTITGLESCQHLFHGSPSFFNHMQQMFSISFLIVYILFLFMFYFVLQSVEELFNNILDSFLNFSNLFDCFICMYFECVNMLLDIVV